MQDRDDQTVISTPEARQARRPGWRVATILGVSLFLALLVLIGLMVWNYSQNLPPLG
jgi:NADH:ubiquinone oxidoreductase subunit 6 (subunit J)